MCRFYRYQGYPALRAGALLCEQDCKNGMLDYRLDETLASSTDGPMVSNMPSISMKLKVFLTFDPVGGQMGREQQQI